MSENGGKLWVCQELERDSFVVVETWWNRLISGSEIPF